jgi:hypothetical protein
MSKSRPTQSQMKSLVDLVAKDPLLCASKFTPTLTQKIAIEIWQNIAEQLNTLPGAEKSGCKWKKVSYLVLYLNVACKRILIFTFIYYVLHFFYTDILILFLNWLVELRFFKNL